VFLFVHDDALGDAEELFRRAVFVRKQRVRFAPDAVLGADRFIGGAQKQGHVQLAMADCSPT
jgi:hypothetical protein